MQKLHVIFAVDRAGLVGEDGETHHGIYDVGFLRHAPGLKILCPGSRRELREMLRWAVNDQTGPIAIRYPRGGDGGFDESAWDPEKPVVCCHYGKDATIIAYGNMTHNAVDAAQNLFKQGLDVTVLRLLCVEPIPYEEILRQAVPNAPVLVIEETDANCGIVESVAYNLRQNDPEIEIYGMNLGHRYVQHGNVKELHTHCGVDANHIVEFLKEVLKDEN